MKLETSKILSSYIFNHIDSEEFEKWIYSNESLEDEIGTELYLELVSINFKEKDSNSRVVELLENRINLGALHKIEIIDLINQIVDRAIQPLKGISELYQWAELGYLFLGRVNLIGNFGEQGKSLVHILDDTIDDESQWSKLNQIDSNFIGDLKTVKNKLENDSIKLTGESETYQFIGKQYKFEE